MTDSQREHILRSLAALLADFEGREYSGVIDRQTWFFADLGFSSIDAVVLGETLEQRYGKKIPFARFLSGLAERGAEDVTVGELVDFLEQSLRG